MSLERASSISRSAGSLVLAASLLLALPSEGLATGTPAPEDSAAGDESRIIVRYRPGTASPTRARVRAALETIRRLPTDLPGTEVLGLPPGSDLDAAVAEAEERPEVLYAEPDRPVETLGTVPNDPLFADLWGLKETGANAGIDATAAWDVATDASPVPVAVVDTGMDMAHPDLVQNLWVNPGESGAGRETNGVDDDGNGFVDDVHGWDFVDRNASPTDPSGHGTHVAGTIGARGDNRVGVTGVSWRAALMPLRVIGADGVGWTSNVAAAFRYAARNGARVVNASLGGSGFSQTLLNAVESAPETLFVVAAGNDGRNNDTTPTYPCAFPSPNLVCVAASEPRDTLASFSNYGPSTVDLAAPGTSILSTWPGGRYARLMGTSMASPHAAGVAALLWSRRPEASLPEVRDAILAGVDRRTAFVGRTVSGGRLSARGAFEAMGDRLPDPPRWTTARPRLTWDAEVSPSSVAARYELWVDGALDRADIRPGATSTRPAGPLSHGLHRWWVVAVLEDGGAQELTPRHPIRVDTRPPARPRVRGWRRTGGRRVRVAWRTSDVGSGVRDAQIRYRRKRAGGHGPYRMVRRGGSPARVRVPRRGVWCFQVRARDRVGNASRWSAAHCTRAR